MALLPSPNCPLTSCSMKICHTNINSPCVSFSIHCFFFLLVAVWNAGFLFLANAGFQCICGHLTPFTGKGSWRNPNLVTIKSKRMFHEMITYCTFEVPPVFSGCHIMMYHSHTVRLHNWNHKWSLVLFRIITNISNIKEDFWKRWEKQMWISAAQL